MAAALVLFLAGMLLVGTAIGDCFDDAKCIAAKNGAGHILWIAPISALVIFVVVRWIVDRIRTGRP